MLRCWLLARGAAASPDTPPGRLRLPPRHPRRGSCAEGSREGCTGPAPRPRAPLLAHCPEPPLWSSLPQRPLGPLGQSLSSSSPCDGPIAAGPTKAGGERDKASRSPWSPPPGPWPDLQRRGPLQAEPSAREVRAPQASRAARGIRWDRGAPSPAGGFDPAERAVRPLSRGGTVDRGVLPLHTAPSAPAAGTAGRVCGGRSFRLRP